MRDGREEEGGEKERKRFEEGRELGGKEEGEEEGREKGRERQTRGRGGELVEGERGRRRVRRGKVERER